MNKIYDEYYYKIYNWAISKTNNKEDAEDLTNSVFLAIFEYFSKNIEVQKIENLIWKIAYNLWCTKAKDYIKEKNITIFDEKYDPGYEMPILDKIIYKEIINNLDNIGLTDKEKILLDSEVEIDGEKVNINEYLLANMEEDIKAKVKDLVDILIYSKYGSITFYYDQIFNDIINEYQKDKVIDKEKIKLCIEIMNNYYDGVIGIDNLFNA